MIPRSKLCLLLSLVTMPVRASDPSDLLHRVRLAVARQYEETRDVVCRLCVERWERPNLYTRLALIDRLRLEVVYAGNKEFYNWADSPAVNRESLREIVGDQGLISTGNFVLHMAHSYLDPAVELRIAGEEPFEGHAALKVAFRVSSNLSKWILQTPQGLSARVGFQGHGWHDPSTLRLLRLSMATVSVPGILPYSKVTKVIDYAPLSLPGGSRNLPVRASTELTGRRGDFSRNVTLLEDCRQYLGEARLSYDTGPRAAAPFTPPLGFHLPAGLTLVTSIVRDLDVPAAARGDRVEMRLESPVLVAGTGILPQGTALFARIRYARCGAGPPGCLVHLEPETWSHGGQSGRFAASITSCRAQADRTAYPSHLAFPSGSLSAESRANVLSVSGQETRLPAGLRIEWLTRDLPGAAPAHRSEQNN